MTPRRHYERLSARDRQILRDVIYTFIETGEAVSSRTVAKQQRQELSAASIRNVMADLEEWGYLSQPHSSSGRIPTAQGYHFFIDSLMQGRTLPARERRYIRQHLEQVAGYGEDLTAVASQLLSELSNQVGIVLTPVLDDTILKAIEFVPLSDRKLLCVVVSASGFIDNKVIEIEEALTREALVKISNYLTENFAGMTLGGIRDRLLRLMDDERAQVDQLLARAIFLAQLGLDRSPGPEVVVGGTEALLNNPDLADLERVRRLFETFADKARLVAMLNECMKAPGVRVFIGDDSDLTSELDFSLVATTYGVGDRALGSLGIFGPSRMEYPRVIPLVDFLGETLSKALASRT